MNTCDHYNNVETNVYLESLKTHVFNHVVAILAIYMETRLNDTITWCDLLPGFFCVDPEVSMLHYCANLKAIRYVSTIFG